MKTIFISIAILVSAAAPAPAQADTSKVDPKKFEEINKIQVPRCAALYALEARKAENEGDQSSASRHEERFEYWLAVTTMMSSSEDESFQKIGQQVAYWKRVVDTQGVENMFSVILAQETTCDQVKKKLEGTQ